MAALVIRFTLHQPWNKTYSGRPLLTLTIPPGLHNDPKAQRSMQSIEHLAVRDWSVLPAEVWGVIARAALRAEGDDVHVWKRLRCVNRTWHASLEGGCCHGNSCGLRGPASQGSLQFATQGTPLHVV